MHLIIDIETIGAQPDTWQHTRALERRGPRTSEEKALADTALHGTYGSITVACIKLGGRPVETYSAHPHGERYALNELAKRLRGIYDDRRMAGTLTWAGYNIAGFDLRFLWQRLLAHDFQAAARIVPAQEKPWSGRLLDLMAMWCGTGMGRMVPKEDVARALGIAVPDDAISGSDAPVLWAAGEYEAVARHCQQDVEMTAQILERLT